MLKKLLMLLTAAFLFLGCHSHKAGEIKMVEEVLEANCRAIGQFTSSLDKASNAREVVYAIDEYGDNLDRILPKAQKVKEIFDKYNSSNPPAELEEVIKKTKDLSGKFLESYGKIIDYSDRPEVNEAIARVMKKNMAMPALRI